MNNLQELKTELSLLEKQDKEMFLEVSEKLTYLLQPNIRFFWDFRWAASNYLKIVDKKKKTCTLNFNSLQETLFTLILEEMPIRRFLLKARKFGMSTFILAMYYWDCITSQNTTSTIIAHEYEPSERLFRIVSYMNDRLPSKFKMRAKKSNAREIFFDKTNSCFFIGSAQKRDFGRSDTINNLHISEFAFWPQSDNLLSALLESVPEEQGNIFIETTPSSTPYFKEFATECKRGDGAYIYSFFPWHHFSEYSKTLDYEGEEKEIEKQLHDEEKVMRVECELTWEQMKFWLAKRKSLRRKVWQEYPPDDMSCYTSSQEHNFFDTRKLQQIYMIVSRVRPIEERDSGKIRIYKKPEEGRVYLIGADTSGGVAGSLSAGTCIEYVSADEVFELRGLYQPHSLAIILAELGYEYNCALIAVELNNHGHSVLNTLHNQIHYPLLYRHIDDNYDEWLRKQTGVGKTRRSGKKKLGKDMSEGRLGWPTDSKTRPIMFDDLRSEVIDDLLMVVRSIAFIQECFGIREKDGSIFSDDLMDTVIARAIVWQVRKRSLTTQMTLSSWDGKNKKENFAVADMNLPWEETEASGVESIEPGKRKLKLKGVLNVRERKHGEIKFQEALYGKGNDRIYNFNLRSSPVAKLKKALFGDLEMKELDELMKYDEQKLEEQAGAGILSSRSRHSDDAESGIRRRGRKMLTVKGDNKNSPAGWEL